MCVCTKWNKFPAISWRESSHPTSYPRHRFLNVLKIMEIATKNTFVLFYLSSKDRNYITAVELNKN